MLLTESAGQAAAAQAIESALTADTTTSTESTETITETAKEQITWLSSLGEKATTFLIKLAICIVVYIVVTRVLKKLLSRFSKHLEKRGMEPTARQFLENLIYYGVTIFLVAAIIVQLGIVEASSIAALIASAGVAISLALQGVLSNFAGGILLISLHPFRVGDYIRLKDSSLEGTVTKIDMYYTTIQDVYGITVSIPNSELTGKAVENLASDGLKGIYVKVGISYSEDIDRAKAVLEDIKEHEPRLISGRGRIFVDSLGESSVVVGILGIVRVEDYVNTLWDLNETVKKRFDEEGIEIPFNQLDVHIRKDG